MMNQFNSALKTDAGAMSPISVSKI